MTTKHAADRPDDESRVSLDAVDRNEVARLFTAALDGDHRAEAALVLLGGFDAAAHRASVALATAGHDVKEPTPPDVLASVERTLAALRDRHRSS
ncbi:hypothetical protein [Actinomycetospora straminea]|uniref:Uncharacterized protein n=1 Tax=Actinomycetospora straminea TaxID=663607 RepID=A0ABP9F6L1_9PSEU|nr:hypothetical protein [Actinomycetospora straminea]MDD7933714.1 hypothetical protein [Actinomycetospora straminea]